MRKKRTRKQPGSPPGTLVYTGKPEGEFELTLIQYNEHTYRELTLERIEDIAAHLDPALTTWINVVGLHRVSQIETLGKMLGLHPLTVEDVLNVTQRPKVEDYEHYLFVVLHMLTFNDEARTVESEQVSMVLKDHLLVTFQERKGDVFDPVRERLRRNRGIIRRHGADYLLYALVDVIVDHYFLILEHLEEETERLEEEVVEHPTPHLIRALHAVKRNLITLRKSVWPLRELLSTLSRGESPLISQMTLYLRDVYDHTIQVIDTVETLRDVASGLLDVYLSSVSNRMNEIMKVLTIIATIFMPLTFIAGIYGMNFRYMPELEWKWGYPAVLGLMCFLGIGMLLYFKKKKWL
ncbi:magnesium and cobalt transport protein CorA [Spirochaeta thermophila DSM 6578]|uniref:Magnesium transport protein CorA n=1 Tax=Winmispira thermophila (strain ATCC 700085 / DSM 6578 / Z-1203) TaxID=869211 RepID=G0GB72_WINT7|nr:magnesium/cobalt transporter CorA [Spirochaeta thermophila]AEJ61096.1 magnesium and cobalt transport protein CorA [Spirochaeta thermophila DSM 6578]